MFSDKVREFFYKRNPSIPSRDEINIRILLFLFGLMFIFLICGHQAATQSLWTDDVYSLTTAEEPVVKIIQLTHKYVPGYYDHPPLYFIILHFFLYLGNSPFILRFLSLFTIGISIGIWGSLLYKEKKSVLYSLLLMILIVSNSIVCFQAINVRMYGLYLLLSSVIIYLIKDYENRIKDRKKSYIFLLGFLLAISVYTVYFAQMIFVCIGVYILIKSFSKESYSDKFKFLLPGIIACAIALFLLLPYAPTIHQMLKEGKTGAEYSTTRFEQIVSLIKDLSGSYPGLIFIIIGIILMVFVKTERKESLTLFFSFVLIPFLLMVILTPKTRSVLIRYIFYIIPVMYYLIVSVAIEFSGRLKISQRNKYLCLILIILLISIFNIYNTKHTYFKETMSWWTAAAILENNAKSDEVIMTGGYLSGELIVYHTKNAEKYSFVHYITDINKFYLTGKSKSTIWYVNSTPLPEGYQKIVDRYFPYRLIFSGNQGLSDIMVYSKKDFSLPDGTKAIYQAPIPLEYEK